MEHDEWWDNLPKPVKESISVSLKQIDKGQTYSNAEAFKRLKKPKGNN